MPGTTRYSATFDRTYEEDDRADPPPTANTRRSRSLSWQAPAGFGGRPYTPLGGRPPSQRSSSTDNGKAPDYLATRAAAKAAAKAHNNPFQFVKVGTCPLYKNAEELLKKTKEVKKQDVLKEEEEDWQSNLDSWKSRRRKMSEDVFRRQEEIKQFELEEQEAQLAQKKTKTFSEMVESRANRGRTLSLCLLSSPLEFQDWEFENKTFKNGSCSTFTDESEENSTVNSEDEGVSVRGRPGRPPHYNNHNNHRTNSDAHIEQNGSKLDLHNENFNKLADISADNGQIKPKEGSYIDSGLESISSSHRAGDTPDSGSDFSQDSNSSIDCDSPRTGVNILEEFRTKSLQTQGQKLKVKLSLVDQSEEFGFTFQCGKDSGQVHITSVIQGSIAESSGVHLGDQIISINGVDVNSRTHRDIASIVQKGREKEEVNLLLWRHIKANGFSNGEKHVENPVKSNKSANVNAKSESQMYERSIESENEMFVDDYEELERQSELLNSSNKSETTCTSSQGDSKGIIPLSTSKDSIKPPLAPKMKESVLNGAVNEQTKNGKDDSELNSENQKKNIIKVKRVRKKGVYALDALATPNPIPQEGIPVSTLYPLSPVTELPSPAEESKSIASTLSSNSTTLTSNSLTSSITKEKPKEAEVKSSSSSTKENSKTTTSDLKCASLKTSVPSSKIEKKTESSNDLPLASSIKNKDQNSVESSPDENSKILSSPKKTKTRVKKTNTLCEQNPSEASPKNEESMNKSVAQVSDLSVKKVTSDSQSQKESSTNTLSDTKKVSAKKEGNIVDSQEKDKISKETSLDSHKIIAETSNSSVSITALSKDVTKENSSKKEENTSPVTKSKEIKEINKSENKESSKREKDTPLVEPDLCGKEAKLIEPKNKNSLSEEKKKLSLNLGVQKQVENSVPVSPVTPAKSPKTPQEEKMKPPFTPKKGKAKSKENNITSVETAVSLPEVKSADIKEKTCITNNSSSSAMNKNISLPIVAQNQPQKSAEIPLISNLKSPLTPKDGKANQPFAQKTEKTISKDNCSLSPGIAPNMSSVESTASKDKTSVSNASTTVTDKAKNLTLKIGVQNQPANISTKPEIAKANQSKTPDEKLKLPLTQKKETEKPKNTNSQKVNSPAKQNEDLMNFNSDSLNIVFQSEPKSKFSENQSVNIKNSENNNDKKTVDLAPDIPPVEKVAEEMEKLILEQLEEEERAKELASVLQSTNSVESPEHLLIAPSKSAEPPKEKPPPPPPSANEGSQKDPSLKRVNSTKRIKKEIHKRRSNFLGIDNVDESIVCSEPSIPPPPALEEILKAEMELDRQSRLKIESASTERLTLEEKEIMQKEREIIESLESEEREKQLLNGSEDFENNASAATSDAIFEDDRIISLKNERKRIENERFLTEEQQQLNQAEEKQLREREEFIRKQEAGKSAESLSDSSLSVTANVPNTSKPVLSSLTETESKVLLSDSVGEGKSVSNNSSIKISENKSSECDAKVKEKPALPPKPLKKKEAIRKERERLRQEQEALQREREEHRQKLMLEQEELLKHQKSHAPDAPASRLGPLPPLVPPNFPPQLTTTTNAIPNARESTSFPSRSHHGTPNNAAGSMNAVELMGPPVVRQNKMPASRKAVVQIEAWGQQKMPSVRKQNHDSLTESRYNQNHWLIQEAEMRRIAELKERQQRATQLPCSQTHLAEDDVCSNPPRVPVISPPHNPHLNYAVQDKMWNYGQSNMPPKKYPPPVVKEPLHAVYPRETVSQQPPTKPSRVVPMERQEQMLSVSGRKRCSHCNEELGRGAAMIIESLQLYYHIHCFQCCVCQAQLGNGSCGTDVRVRNNKLHCHNCYSNDEAGLKFSQV